MSSVSPTEADQVTPPPSPSRFLFVENEEEDEAVESDARSDDSDYVLGVSSGKKSKSKKKKKITQSKKRLRQGVNGSSSKKKKAAAAKSRAADGDEDEEFKPDDDDDDDEEDIDMSSPARSVSPSGGKFKSSKKQKKDAKNWLDDGCAVTFAQRIEDFKRALKNTVRDERVSFYNSPRHQQLPVRDDEEEEEKDDLLDDGDFHDEVLAQDQTADAVAAIDAPKTAEDDKEQYYAPDDVFQTDSGLVVPKYIYNHLFPHQKDCLEWLLHLHERNTGGILGDEMGLGKTVVRAPRLYYQCCLFLLLF